MSSYLPQNPSDANAITAQMVGEPRPAVRRTSLWRTLIPLAIGLLFFCGLPLLAMFVVGGGISLDTENKVTERYHSWMARDL
jgi:hypothetical protein